MREDDVTPEEILKIKQEFYEKHKIDGTDKPVLLSDFVARIIVASRKEHENYLNSVHKSHDMTDWRTEVMSPVGTARFYQYRECKNCGGAQYYHAAGKFIDPELKEKCDGQ